MRILEGLQAREQPLSLQVWGCSDLPSSNDEGEDEGPAAEGRINEGVTGSVKWMLTKDRQLEMQRQ